MSPFLVFIAAFAALVYAIAQTVVNVLRSRRAMEYSARMAEVEKAGPPPVPPPADAQKATVPGAAQPAPPQEPAAVPSRAEPPPYIPTLYETVLQAWSPFYTFCVALALFGI